MLSSARSHWPGTQTWVQCFLFAALRKPLDKVFYLEQKVWIERKHRMLVFRGILRNSSACALRFHLNKPYRWILLTKSDRANVCRYLLRVQKIGRHCGRSVKAIIMISTIPRGIDTLIHYAFLSSACSKSIDRITNMWRSADCSNKSVGISTSLDKFNYMLQTFLTTFLFDGSR